MFYIWVNIKTQIMAKQPKVSIRYQVAVDDYSTLGADGYTKYYERYRMRDNNELPEGEEVYGLAQAIEHVAEYYGRDDEYAKKRALTKATIQRVVTIVDEVPFTPLAPIRVVGKHLASKQMTLEQENEGLTLDAYFEKVEQRLMIMLDNGRLAEDLVKKYKLDIEDGFANGITFFRTAEIIGEGE